MAGSILWEGYNFQSDDIQTISLSKWNKQDLSLWFAEKFGMSISNKMSEHLCDKTALWPKLLYNLQLDTQAILNNSVENDIINLDILSVCFGDSDLNPIYLDCLRFIRDYGPITEDEILEELPKDNQLINDILQYGGDPIQKTLKWADLHGLIKNKDKGYLLDELIMKYISLD